MLVVKKEEGRSGGKADVSKSRAGGKKLGEMSHFLKRMVIFGGFRDRGRGARNHQILLKKGSSLRNPARRIVGSREIRAIYLIRPIVFDLVEGGS